MQHVPRSSTTSSLEAWQAYEDSAASSKLTGVSAYLYPPVHMYSACRVPGVVELCGTADDATNVYLVFEPCSGGDLYKRLAHKGLFDEGQLCKEVSRFGLSPTPSGMLASDDVGTLLQTRKPG